jgi:hypothetical protein
MKGLLAIVLLGLLAFSMAQDCTIAPHAMTHATDSHDFFRTAATTVTVQKQTTPVAVVATQVRAQLMSLGGGRDN